jgi:DNA primase
MSRAQHSFKSYYLSESKLRDLLHNLGVTVAGDTGTDLIAYCPFHSNRDSPAFNISKSTNHLWKCHNGKCNSQGNIISLITRKGYTVAEAERMVLKGSLEVTDLEKVIEAILGTNEKKSDHGWSKVDPTSFADADADNGFVARQYLAERGIGQGAYDHFLMGYAASKNMLTIPVFDERANLCGVIGREIEKKRYQYSTGLSRGELIWNIQNAKVNDSIILTEGALDSVYVWQAGYENVGAVLGSAISPKQWDQLRKYFTSIICFFDNDEAGEALTESICESVTDLAVFTVEYPDRMVEYIDDGEKKTRPVKDAGELTAEEIQHMLENKLSSLLRLF